MMTIHSLGRQIVWTLCIATISAGLMASAPADSPPVEAGKPQAILQSAVAFWDMRSSEDQAGAPSDFRPVIDSEDDESKVVFDVELAEDKRDASLAVGGDGRMVELRNAGLTAGAGADGELNISGDQLTILLRLKNDTDNWDCTLFSKHGGHERLQYNIYGFDRPGDSGMDLGFELYTAAGQFWQRPYVESAKAGRWHTIVGRYDGQSLDIFFDGRRLASTPAQGDLRPGGGQPLIVGAEKQGEQGLFRHFSGALDHAAIWDRRLSDDEIATLSGYSPPAVYAEPDRPQFHFTAPENWLNDPNGLVYAFGQYHLFYQHNPYGNRWGHMSWGHAVSDDLLHWETLPLALREEEGTMIFSGSAVYDEENRSGFAPASDTQGQGPLVAIYTAHQTGPPVKQSQAIAYSNDEGGTWTKYAGNPVIDRDSSAFRDPKVFWYARDEKWVLLVALSSERKLLFFESTDLKAWELMSEFTSPKLDGRGIWECPELVELPLDGDPHQTRWVLQLSIGHSISGGTGGVYLVGDFDGRRFVDAAPEADPLWVDYGRDFYALQAFNNIPEDDGRRIWLGWLNNWSYANDIPTGIWRGAMSVPRELRLVSTQAGPRLLQQPVREFESLRGRPIELQNQTISENRDPLQEVDFNGRVYEIVAEFELDTARRFGFELLKGNGERTRVGYDLRLDELFVTRRFSGQTDFTDDFGDHQWAPLPPGEDDTIKMRILVDRSIVEVFGGQGEVVITDRVFPSTDSDALTLFTDGGDVLLKELKVYPIANVWEQAQR